MAGPEVGRVDAMRLEQLFDVGAVLGGDLGFEVGGCQLALALVGHLLGDQQVDAVGLAFDMVVDPLEVDLELLRGVLHGAEHAQAAGL